MSYCKEQGKDQVIFATEEELSQPSKAIINVNEEDDQAPGLILANGDINWECPCLGGMATGPCGVEFREAFSCFHYSQAEPKGSDCYEPFMKMQSCMTEYPEVYPPSKSPEEELQSLPLAVEAEAESGSGDGPGLIDVMPLTEEAKENAQGVDTKS